MALPKRTIRGLQDIHTHSGRVDETHQPYKAYMKIAALEMEKARRNKERESANKRIQDIDTRFKDIEDEKQKIVQALEQHSKGSRDEPSGLDHQLHPRRSTNGFKIRY